MLSKEGYAQNDYLYNPMESFYLGRGFSKQDYSKSFYLEAIKYKVDTQTNNATNYFLNSEIIFDEKTLRDKLHFDTKIQSKSLKYKASAKFNLDIEKNFNFNSLNILFEASSEFGKLYISEISLKQEAALLLNDPSDPSRKKFTEKYGTGFMSEQRRGVYIYAMISISNISSDLRNQISFSASGSLKTSAVNASAKININKEIYEANKTNRISIKVWGSGGEGISLLANVFQNLSSNTNNIDSIKSALATYIRTLDYTKSVPIGFKGASYDLFGIEYKDLWTEENEERIATLFDQYHKFESINKSIKELLNSENEYKKMLLSDSQISELKKQQKKVTKYMSVLAELHKKTVANPDNRDEIPEMEEPDLSSLIPIFPVFRPAFWLSPSSETQFSTQYNLYSIPQTNLLDIKVTGSQEITQPYLNYSTYLGSESFRLPGLVIYNNFNDKNYFKLIDDIKILNNGQEFISFKQSLNNDQKLNLKSTDYIVSTHLSSLDKEKNFFMIINKLYEDYAKQNQDYNNGSTNTLNIDYKVVIQDVFQRQNEYPLLAMWKSKEIGSIQKTIQGLETITKATSSVTSVNFDVPLFFYNDSLFCRLYFVMEKKSISLFRNSIPNSSALLELPVEGDTSLTSITDDQVTLIKFAGNQQMRNVVISKAYNLPIKGYQFEYWIERKVGGIILPKKKKLIMLNGEMGQIVDEIIAIEL